MSLYEKLFHKKGKTQENKEDNGEIKENNSKVSNDIKNNFMEVLQEQVCKQESKKVSVETQIRPGDGMGFNSKISG